MKSFYLYILIGGLFIASACSSTKKTAISSSTQEKEVKQEPRKSTTSSSTQEPVVKQEPKKTTTKPKRNTTSPSKSKNRMLVIETPHGNMTVELYNETPQHRDNFIKLVEEGFFNDLLFHRVIRNFMIQGGDPNSKGAAAGVPLGTGGPGYTVPAEFNEKFIHTKGALSAARQGDQVNPQKASSGSQFYIVQGKVENDQMLDAMQERKGIQYSEEQRTLYKTLGGTPFLDMEYTVFGKVVEGLDVIDKIAAVQTDRRAGDRPVEDVTMKIKVLK